MKRDMDLVREILILVSESSERVSAEAFVNTRHDLEKVIYTIDIMKQADLIDARIIKAFPSKYVGAEIISLTWAGNDFLDTIKSNKVWDEVKKTLAKTTISASMHIIKQLAEKIIYEIILHS